MVAGCSVLKGEGGDTLEGIVNENTGTPGHGGHGKGSGRDGHGDKMAHGCCTFRAGADIPCNKGNGIEARGQVGMTGILCGRCCAVTEIPGIIAGTRRGAGELHGEGSNAGERHGVERCLGLDDGAPVEYRRVIRRGCNNQGCIASDPAVACSAGFVLQQVCARVIVGVGNEIIEPEIRGLPVTEIEIGTWAAGSPPARVVPGTGSSRCREQPPATGCSRRSGC